MLPSLLPWIGVRQGLWAGSFGMARDQRGREHHRDICGSCSGTALYCARLLLVPHTCMRMIMLVNNILYPQALLRPDRGSYLLISWKPGVLRIVTMLSSLWVGVILSSCDYQARVWCFCNISKMTVVTVFRSSSMELNRNHSATEVSAHGRSTFPVTLWDL